ncbi:MAG TPA: winged helix DNA-binding domain-containing protein [Chloroflexia bacterium]|nr:winged helix DNA-binding domain-containing protein [Chloroflexia bacterium]
MADMDIARLRLHNQGIEGARFDRPEDVVGWLGAVQAQDYPAAKWALGLRLRDARDADVERAFADGAILRTHVMRPTWHFVAPADIRWLLALTAPRVHAASAYQYRKLELDDATFSHSHDVLAKALEGGKQLTRPELGSALQQAGIDTHDLLRLTYIIMHAELEGIVCSGAKRGKQFTYALLDERAPASKPLTRDEALAELTLRYFTSHGPATLKDFVWWSGLTATDAKAGLEAVKPQLTHGTKDGLTYWFAQSTPFAQAPTPTAHLFPNYDEYGVGYTDRSALVDPTRPGSPDPQDSFFYLGNLIVVEGKAVGSWKRTLAKHTVALTTQTFTPLTPVETAAITVAAQAYGAFLDMPVVLA